VADAAPSDLARDLIIARNDNIAHRDLINNLSNTDILQIDDFLATGIDERGRRATRRRPLPTHQNTATNTTD